MIRFRRELQIDTRARRKFVTWASPTARAYVVESEGLLHDSSVTSPVTSLPPALRRNAVVVLDGEYLLERGDRWIDLRPGDVVMERPVGRERWMGRRFSLLVLEWVEPRMRTDVVVGRLGASELRNAHGLAKLIEDGYDGASAMARLAALFGVDAAACATTPSEPATTVSLQPTATALSRAMSSLSDGPMWVDFERELAISERHARRAMGTVLAMLTGQETTLRTYLRATRLGVVSQLLTLPDLRVDEIATRVGYGSSRALATALQQAGLPSATALRGALQKGVRDAT